MKRTMKFEFDTSNNEDLAKLTALNVMARALENPTNMQAFMQLAQAIQQGRRIEIMPLEAPKAVEPKPVATLKPVEAPPKDTKPPKDE